MNIGFDASRAFIDNRTGTENYSYQLLYNLSKIDRTNNYHIYLRPNSRLSQIASRISEKQNKIDIRYVIYDIQTEWPQNFHFKTIPFPKLWTQAGLAAETFIDSKVDLLFVPSHTLPIFKKPGLKTVITVHDLGAEFLPGSHQLKQRLYLKMMTQYQLKTATHIIAVSQATKDDLIQKIGIKDDKITVIHEGYDRKLFKAPKTADVFPVLNKYSLSPKKYFLFVGTIQPRKNLVKLIESYALFLKKTNQQQMSTDLPTLALAGSKGWLSDEIYALPAKLNIENYVKFLGFVPDQDLPVLYNQSQGFLFPSLFEGFGLPILEAFACGCPVLTSNVSSMPEVAGNAAILADPTFKEEITEGIIKLYLDHELASGLIKKGYAQAKKFSWGKAAQETLKVFEQVHGK